MTDAERDWTAPLPKCKPTGKIIFDADPGNTPGWGSFECRYCGKWHRVAKRNRVGPKVRSEYKFNE